MAKGLKAHYDKLVAKEARKEVAYAAPKRDDYPTCPPFPDNITKVSYKKLGRLHGEYTAFSAYVNEAIAEQKFHVSRIKILLRRRRAAIILSSGGIKLQKQAAVHRDAEHNLLVDELLKAQTTLNGYQAMMWTLKDFVKAIDFETTRRGFEAKGA